VSSRVTIVFSLIYLLLLLFFVSLLIRLVFDWVQMFARDWRPKGAALVTAHSVYSVTDPALKVLRRVLPPLRIGSVSLDLGFLVLIFGVGIVMAIVSRLA
jgi:YggT family protein